MYNIKGPSKIVAKTARRGISQNIDNYSSSSKSKSIDDDKNNNKNIVPESIPKPVFQKKITPANTRHDIDDEITPHHSELIKFVQESWTQVCSELEQEKQVESEEKSLENVKPKVTYFEDVPCPHLNEFKPFDLEAWWGRRLYTQIINLENSKILK